MKNNNHYYTNRIIKLISPITCQTFKIELNGEESELRELLGTILEIEPKSIKGLRDSYNNYYTLSSAVKNPLINNDLNNYYTVVLKINNYNQLNQLTSSNKTKNKSLHDNNEFSDNDLSLDDYNFTYPSSNPQHDNFLDIEEYLNFADYLYKNNYIDSKVKNRLIKLIQEKNKEVITLLYPYLNLDSYDNYNELTKKIKPIINSEKQISSNRTEKRITA